MNLSFTRPDTPDQPVLARNNPFRVERVLGIRYRFAGSGWTDLLRDLEALDYRAAIVGRHGSGKTTLLEDLGRNLAGSGVRVKSLFLNEDLPVAGGEIATLLSGLTEDDVVLVDGADLMGWFGWLRFKFACRTARGLVIAAHREGMLPTLVQCRTSPELLSEIIADLLGFRDPSLESRVPELYRRHNGNIREAIRELYDEYSRGPA